MIFFVPERWQTRACLILFIIVILQICIQHLGFVQSLATDLPPSSRGTDVLILGLGRVGTAVQNQITANRQALELRNLYGTVRIQEKNNRSNEDETSSKMSIANDACLRILSSHDTDTLCKIAISCSHLFVTIPPPRNDPEMDEFLNHLYDNVVKNLPKYSWIGVLSTTGVYGNHNGAWITEETDTHPCPENLKHYLEMEETWKQRVKKSKASQQNHVVLRIFRCAGIYGADRSALHTVFRNGLPPPMVSGSAPENTPKGDITNRIHVDDLATVIVESMMVANHRSHLPGAVVHRVYNVADDCPESRTVVMQYAAHLLQKMFGADMKTNNDNEKAQRSTDSRAVRRSQDQKRVSNQRIKDEILCNQSLKYPSYKEGLKEIILDKTNPWWQEKLGG